MKTEVMLHCGNAPKMERVIDLTVALAGKNAIKAKENVREDFVWNEVGEGEVANYTTLSEILAKRPSVSKITVNNGLSHGNGAMCEGVLKFTNGDTLYFCSVAKFTSTAKDALVKEIHFYFQN